MATSYITCTSHSTQTFYTKEREATFESMLGFMCSQLRTHCSPDVLFLLLGIVYLADVIVRLFGLGRSYWRGGWNIFDVVVVIGTFTTTTAILLGSGNFVIQQLQKLFLVSIAFKLVQKFNNLNQLFKTAVFVLLISICPFLFTRFII